MVNSDVNRLSASTLGNVTWLNPEAVAATKPQDCSSRFLLFNRLSHHSHTIAKLLLQVFRNIFAAGYRLRIMEGKERNSGAPIRIAYIGGNTSFHYLTDLFFEAVPDPVQNEPHPWWRLNQVAADIRKETDLTVMDVDFPLDFFIKKEKCLNIPRWIIQRLPIADTWDGVMNQLRRKTRREAQRYIRKFNFKSFVIDGRYWADCFYDSLYKPHIEKRHGLAAEVVSRKRFKSVCSRGQIIGVVYEGTIVGAVVVLPSKNRLIIEWAGMDKNLTGAQYAGATDALDYFTLLYAYQQGYDYLDMGPSRARLNDGLLRYKRKWGAEIYPKTAPQGCVLISPNNFSEAVRSVFVHNKFISQEDGTLVGRLILTKGSDSESAAEIEDSEWVNGLGKLLVFDLNQDHRRLEFGSKNIELINLLESENPHHRFVASVRLRNGGPAQRLMVP
jgi:hypothetical protein